MTKNKIAIFLELSYTNDALDQKAAETIAGQLKRKELKQYINALRQYEFAKTVTVTLPKDAEKKYEDMIKVLFRNRKIVYNRDKSLIGGLRIQDNDSIYELSIKEVLGSLYKFVTKI